MDPETAEEIKRHFNVVAEGLRTEIRTVAEGLAASNERLDRIEARLTEEFDEIKGMIRLSLASSTGGFALWRPTSRPCGPAWKDSKVVWGREVS